MKKFKKKRYFFLITVILLMVVANSCITLRKSDKKIYKKFNKNNQKPEIHHTVYNGISVRYIADKLINKNLPTIIFVHGAPGSSADFYKHLQDIDLQKKANLVSVDRLGYGYSNFGKSETSISEQAKFVDFIAEKYNHKKIILVGWSFGGPIVAKMTIGNSNYAHVVLIAPAVSAKDEKHFALGKLAKWKLTKWFVPKVFVVAEDEKLTHAKELEILEKQWKNIKTPITYYHGDKDWLVPYNNMKYLQSKISDSVLKCVTIKDGSHFIPFKNYDLIKTELLTILKKDDLQKTF